MMQNNNYQTKDLGEAASLLTSNCILKNIFWKDNTAYFIFDNLANCEKISQKYFFENLTLPARLYYENLKMVKRKLYTSQQTEGARVTFKVRGGEYK